MPRLSLVIPCYNEEKNLPLLVSRCAEALTRPDIEVVLVDNGSKDGTPMLLPELIAPHPNLRSIRVEVNQGYGFGVLSGLRAATGGILGWTHADMQTDPKDALAGLARFESAADADRLFVKGLRGGRPVFDVAFTVGMSLFESALMGQRLWDINAQPTMFTRRFFESWQHPPHDFSLDLFAFVMARRAGLRIERFPVHFGPRANGVSHWSATFSGRVRFIRRTMDFSFELRRWLAGAP